MGLPSESTQSHTRSALQNELQTIGVIAHGLDIIYPPENSGLAKEMINCGDCFTEFRSFTKPDKYNFPSRNRVVAGMSDAVIIIESDTKGGSMITADLANGYHKDVFAVPGKITDIRSQWLQRTDQEQQGDYFKRSRKSG